MKDCCKTYRALGLNYCGICEPKDVTRAEFEAGAGKIHSVTRGRKKRKRKPGAGSAVGVSGHTRTPRGPNRGKPTVRVDGYKRGGGRRKRRRKR